MDVPWFPQVELVALDLKSLVGWGAKWHLCFQRPTLLDLVVSDYPGDTPALVLGNAIIEKIREAIKRLPQDEALALEYLLALTKRGDCGPAWVRRTKAIHALGRHEPWETFRKGYELELMRKLAVELLFPTPEEQTA